MEGLPGNQKCDGSSSGRTESPRKLMEVTRSQVDGSCQKVSQPHGTLTKVDGRWLKVRWQHENLAEINGRCTVHPKSWWKLTEALPATRKLTECDGRSFSHLESCRKMTEGLPAAQKVDESWQMVSWCMERWHNLTEVLSAALKVDGSSRKVFRPNAKLTEVNGKFSGNMESWRKWTESLPLHRK